MGAAQSRLKCFVSMTFGNRLTEWVYKKVEKVGKELGFDVVRGDEEPNLALNVRDKVRGMIDEAFMVVVEASGFSWFVAFELFYAIERKPCILLIFNEKLPGKELDRSAFNIFPEKEFILYPLPLPPYEDKISVNLTELFRKGLKKYNNWSFRISEKFILTNGRKVPDNPFDPNLEINGDKKKPDVERELFPTWIKQETDSCPKKVIAYRPRVIIGPPGCGKTVLLLRFAKWLHSKNKHKPKNTDDLSPLIIFLTPDDISKEFKVDEILETIDFKIKEFEKPYVDKKSRIIQPEFLESYYKSGLVYILFDGLDEYITRNHDNLNNIMGEFKKLQRDHGINVIISCRKVLWLQQIKQIKDFEVIKILPFDGGQAIDLLDGITLPKNAYMKDSGDGVLKSWILNPMILSFIKDIHKENKWLHAFESRSKMFELWAQHISEIYGKRYSIESEKLLLFFSDVGLKLLRLRKYAIQFNHLIDLIPSKSDNKALKKVDIQATEILIYLGSQQKVKFFHESVYEFFVIRKLKYEFERVVNENLDKSHLEDLKLSKLEMDYLQSSAYGFLSEMLEQNFIVKLNRKLKESDLLKMPVKLLRNLVEYIGMTFCDNNVENVASLLLSLIDKSDLDIVIRYNAARALERIHPLAPRPYFDYVSDWGKDDSDWTDVFNKARKQPEKPWVMRGVYRKEPSPGKQYAFTPNIKKEMDKNLQHLQTSVSEKLCNILDGLIETAKPSDHELALRLNISHSLIRWYHPDHLRILEKLKKACISKKIEKETFENLSKWVGHDFS
jgi:hypothetical protein